MPTAEAARALLALNPEARNLAQCLRATPKTLPTTIDDLTSELSDASDMPLTIDAPGGSPMIEHWTVDYLVKFNSNLKPVHRVSVIDHDSNHLTTLISEYEQRGEPLILSGYQLLPAWDSDLFSLQNLTAGEQGALRVTSLILMAFYVLTISDFFHRYQCSQYEDFDRRHHAPTRACGPL
jgi:hypothetical protein